MSSKLTKKQSEILDFIVAFMSDKDYAPSYQEIADHFGLTSRSTVHQHIQELKTKGLLDSKFNTTRGLKVASKLLKFGKSIDLPLTGMITAGKPIEAIEEGGEGQRETIGVPIDLIKDPANSYVLQVKGESMIDEGILDGDYVIIRRNPSPSNGDVVVALLNNEYATLKKFFREKNRVRLQPANKAMDPIYAKDPLIQGVVQAVIRRFSTI
ncbi:repressor LexA [archaeon]|nr:repressor LexA [archaeon]|tara:strand:- start:318 stop:950 length:633 start_codon:yes stop_codon:yes gene_type:complete